MPGKELKKKGVARELLWAEYRRTHPDGLGISQLKHYYAQWKSQVNPMMHMEHKAGDKLYVDFAGDKLTIVDPHTGELQPVEVFAAILGASQLTYVEAVKTQQISLVPVKMYCTSIMAYRPLLYRIIYGQQLPKAASMNRRSMRLFCRFCRPL